MAAVSPRVLICEDSNTYAAALARALRHGHELEVVGVCRTAEEAIAALPTLRPDVVTMDIELPGMSGLEAVERIMSSTPLPILVLSSVVGNGSTRAAAALAAGALDAVSKSDLALADPNGTDAGRLRRRLALLSGVRVIRHPRARLQPRSSALTRRVSAVGVCASTGGPHALATLLSSLPATFPVPILVVQHMAAGFTDGLARWLDESVALPVRVAADGDRATRGVWLAPEDAHLTFMRNGRLRLDRETAGDPHRPSGDRLLQSLAECAGREAVAVVLTGMGRDGAAGAQAIRAVGGLTIAQDEETSAVFGMPREAAERGVDLVLPLTAIGTELSTLRAIGEAA